MSVCTQCQTSNRDTARFCATCGAPLPAPAIPIHAGLPTGPGLTGRLPANALLHGRYLIVRKIGQGGMAAVYQATDVHQPGTVWAIKEMSDAAITNPLERPQAIAAFQQEAALLRTLNHPNLPRVADAFAEGGKYYLVMEFVPGHTLEDMLAARTAPFGERDVINLGLQLCEVLGYLHSRNIIFRDLKPSNVMLTPTGHVKLIDFGIVRFFKPGKAHDTMALGTPGYSAPEAASAQTDGRSDIFSLCVTLHQLVTGHDPATSLFRIPPARAVNPAVSPALEQALLRGVQLQREHRWQNIYQVQTALRQAAAASGPPGSARPGPGPASRPEPAPERRISRPTTRLLMSVTQLSPLQQALIAGGAVLGLIMATCVLTPLLARLPIDWNAVPIIGVFGALSYATFQRRGATLLGHVVLTLAMVGTIYAILSLMRIHHYSFGMLILATLVSGAVMEAWTWLLGRIRGRAGSEAWLRELAWLAAMEMVGTVVFFLVLSLGRVGWGPLTWLGAAFFGIIGWFLGDLARQYRLYRRAGFRIQA